LAQNSECGQTLHFISCNRNRISIKLDLKQGSHDPYYDRRHTPPDLVRFSRPRMAAQAISRADAIELDRTRSSRLLMLKRRKSPENHCQILADRPAGSESEGCRQRHPAIALATNGLYEGLIPLGKMSKPPPIGFLGSRLGRMTSAKSYPRCPKRNPR